MWSYLYSVEYLTDKLDDDLMISDVSIPIKYNSSVSQSEGDFPAISSH